MEPLHRLPDMHLYLGPGTFTCPLIVNHGLLSYVELYLPVNDILIVRTPRHMVMVSCPALEVYHFDGHSSPVVDMIIYHNHKRAELTYTLIPFKKKSSPANRIFPSLMNHITGVERALMPSRLWYTYPRLSVSLFIQESEDGLVH
jgi:hypothetical protein